MMEPAALYLRLSQEDGERWGESQSISNQRIFLTQYCQANGFTVAECYIDAPVIIGLKTLRREKCWKRGAF